MRVYTTIEVGKHGGVPISGLILHFEVVHDTEIHEIVSDKKIVFYLSIRKHAQKIVDLMKD